MSLLNDMLKDLDKKKSRHQSSNLSLTMDKENIIKPLIYMFISVFFVFLLILFIYTILHKSKYVRPPDIPSQTESSQPKNKTKQTPLGLAPKSLEDETKIPQDILDKQAFEPEEVEPSDELAQLTPEEWQAEHINLALEAIQEGNDRHAMALLDLVLSKFPTSIEARENLAALYFSHDDLDMAYKILKEGLQLTPHNLNLTMMTARFLVEEGDYHKALKLLNGFNPDIKTKPEFYALLAAIFESTGRTNEAGGLYQSLVKLDPSNGQYWLGLGIAFEHKKFGTQAIEAYKRASQSDNIPTSGRSYADNRLHILQG